MAEVGGDKLKLLPLMLTPFGHMIPRRYSELLLANIPPHDGKLAAFSDLN